MTQLDAIYFRNFRKTHRMKRTDLARVLGMQPKSIWQIETARVRPSARTMRKFEELKSKHKAEQVPLRSK